MDKFTNDAPSENNPPKVAAIQPLPVIVNAPPVENSLGRAKAWALLTFIGIIWGTTFSLAKIAAEGGGHPLGINYWQSLIGAFLLLLACLITRTRIPFNMECIRFYVICGILGSVIPGVIFFYAASKVSPGILSITIATVPLITFVTAAIIGIEKARILRITGVIFGIISIVMLVAPKESLPDPSAVPWIFAALFSAGCYSAENIFVAIKLPKGMPTLAAITGLFIAAATIMTVLVIAMDVFVPLAWPLGKVEAAMISMATISVVAYGIFIYLIIHAGPVFASQTAYVVTFSGVFWGIVIFGEQHSGWIWASFVFMMVALVLVTPREKT